MLVKLKKTPNTCMSHATRMIHTRTHTHRRRATSKRYILFIGFTVSGNRYSLLYCVTQPNEGIDWDLSYFGGRACDSGTVYRRPKLRNERAHCDVAITAEQHVSVDKHRKWISMCLQAYMCIYVCVCYCNHMTSIAKLN